MNKPVFAKGLHTVTINVFQQIHAHLYFDIPK